MAKLVITTKGGDKGTTSLANGERVAKDDRRVELYGTVDECQAALGMARAFCEDGKTAEDIYFIEDYLFGAMAYFAKCDYDEPDPMILESMSDRVKDALPDETMAFVRPGDTKCGAALHLARTIARRADRAATLRINPLRGDRTQTLAALEAAGIAVQTVPWYADALILTNAREDAVTALDIYARGAVYMQSLSSMIPALFLGARAGENVLDMAAAPGEI